MASNCIDQNIYAPNTKYHNEEKKEINGRRRIETEKARWNQKWTSFFRLRKKEKEEDTKEASSITTFFELEHWTISQYIHKLNKIRYKTNVLNNGHLCLLVWGSLFWKRLNYEKWLCLLLNHQIVNDCKKNSSPYFYFIGILHFWLKWIYSWLQVLYLPTSSFSR